MCGRYTLTSHHRPDLKALGLLARDRFNIAPQSDVVVIDEEHRSVLKRWDFSPVWADPPMHLSNARSETLREKPSFRGVKRCVFLADGWYEWHRGPNGKTPFYHFIDQEPLYFAGIYNDDSGCAIVTREALGGIANIHHRQPVLLDARAVVPWLDGHDLFASAISHQVQYHPVSRAVNKPENDRADLLDEAENDDPANQSTWSRDLFVGDGRDKP